jgi:hypothetical protein
VPSAEAGPRVEKEHDYRHAQERELTRKAGVVFLIALCHHGKVPLGTLLSEFCAETALRWSLRILLGPDHSALLIAPAQTLVAQFVESFKDFPPRQKPSSFSVDEVLAQMERVPLRTCSDLRKIVRKRPQFFPCKPILCCAPLFAHIRSRVGPKKIAHSRHNHELIQ